MAKKKKKSDTVLEDITMGKAPPLQPKKIDGKWRYPLDMQVPDKHMDCPRCGTHDIKDTGQKDLEHRTIFFCKDCKIQFIQVKNAKQGWCNKHKRIIIGKECMGCHVFRQNIRQWIADYGVDAMCPHFEVTVPTMEGFHAR